jgi:hypothetical protein
VKPAAVKNANLSTRVFHEASDLTLAAVGAVYVYIHRGSFAPANLPIMKLHENVFANERKRPFPILSILDVKGAHLFPFSKESRDAALELTRDTAAHVSCCAIVLDREGFVASAIRSIVATVNILAKPPYPIRVFGGMLAALAWIESRLDDGSRADFDAGAIANAVNAMRAEAHAAEVSV